MTVDTDIARAALQARQDELEKLSESSADARATVTLDQASVGRLSRMDALQSQAMAQATERQRAAELARIKSALLRMEEDEYGYCIVCGEEIPTKRLEIDPAASHCVKCAK